MRTSLTLLIFITFFSTINIQAQKLSANYFQNNIEVYFSFDSASRDVIRILTNVISIDNVQGTIVYAYANESEYNAFLSYNIEHTILSKPGELIIPEMSDEIHVTPILCVAFWDFGVPNRKCHA